MTSPVHSSLMNWKPQLKAKLQEALRARELEVYGVRRDLIARLSAHDLNILETKEFSSRCHTLWSSKVPELKAAAEKLGVSTTGRHFELVGDILQAEFAEGNGSVDRLSTDSTVRATAQVNAERQANTGGQVNPPGPTEIAAPLYIPWPPQRQGSYAAPGITASLNLNLHPSFLPLLTTSLATFSMTWMAIENSILGEESSIEGRRAGTPQEIKTMELVVHIRKLVSEIDRSVRHFQDSALSLQTKTKSAEDDDMEYENEIKHLYDDAEGDEEDFGDVL
ncbi:hypothetical protein N431DRAFT_534515 [Stipitochalara longipes BDJ]|nr:hypothetical protein N431DRAFT_534515 [Stipitochalara longipes BDJ]